MTCIEVTVQKYLCAVSVSAGCLKTIKENDVSIEVTGLLGLIVLVLDIWAIVKTVDSRNTTGIKVFWILLILMLPVLVTIHTGIMPQKKILITKQ